MIVDCAELTTSTHLHRRPNNLIGLRKVRQRYGSDVAVVLVHQSATGGVPEGELEVSIHQALQMALCNVVLLCSVLGVDALQLELWVPL